VVDPAPADRTPVGPALAPADVVPLDVVPLDVVPLDWLALAPFEVTEPVGDADARVDGLALVDGVTDGVAFGVCLGVSVGWAVGLAPQGGAVALAGVLPGGLVVTVAEAGAEGVVVAVLVGVPVVLGVVVGVLVAVVLPPGLALLVAVLALVLLPAGLELVAAGVTVGLALLEEDGDEPDEHAVGIAPVRLLGTLLGLRWPADETIGLPGPVPPGALWLLWGEEVSPAAWLSWMKAWRSGGTARATPTANKTQAAARAGRSSPSRQSRG
jgi:hypothetical protein